MRWRLHVPWLLIAIEGAASVSGGGPIFSDVDVCQNLITESMGALLGWKPADRQLSSLCLHVLQRSSAVVVDANTRSSCTEFARRTIKEFALLAPRGGLSQGVALKQQLTDRVCSDSPVNDLMKPVDMSDSAVESLSLQPGSSLRGTHMKHDQSVKTEHAHVVIQAKASRKQVGEKVINHTPPVESKMECDSTSVSWFCRAKGAVFEVVDFICAGHSGLVKRRRRVAIVSP